MGSKRLKKHLDVYQGSRATVGYVELAGVSCVEKVFTESDVLKNQEMFNRETSFYNYYNHLDILPELIDSDYPQKIVLSKMEGNIFTKVYAPSISDQSIEGYFNPISYNYGRKLAQMLQVEASHEEIKHNQQLYFSNIDAEKHFNEQIAHFETILLDVDKDAGDFQTMKKILDEATKVMDGNSWWHQQALCKADWAGVNMFVKDQHVVGFIDFESSYWGNRITFLGDILFYTQDPVHNWEMIVKGLTDSNVDMPDKPELLSGFCYSALQHILGITSWPASTTRRLGQWLQFFNRRSERLGSALSSIE
jgi:hypothetical protein